MAGTTKKADALATKEGDGIIPVTFQTVKEYINPLATDAEINLFLNQCRIFGLDPFRKEIYLIKYSQKDTATFVVAYETYLKRAERSRKWAGMKTGIKYDGEKTPENMIAWVEIYRKDWKAPLYHEVYFSEYAQYKDKWHYNKETQKNERTGEKELTKFWRDKPITMLKKVAIAQGTRLAFPDETGNLPYIEEELGRFAKTIENHEDQPMAKTLPHVKDEFTDPEEPKSQAEEKKEPELFEGEEMILPKQLMDITNLITSVRVADPSLPIETIYEGIFKNLEANMGIKVAEINVLSKDQANYVITYLNKWVRHLTTPETKKGRK